MAKRILLTALTVFALWSTLDIVIHVKILGPVYQASAELWSPLEAMKPLYIQIALLLSALVFTTIYAGLIKEKRPGIGLAYGFLWGAANGVSRGFCAYATQSIPYEIVVVWILGTIVEAALAGLVVGYIIKE
jgi:hypothetical protein